MKQITTKKNLSKPTGLKPIKTKSEANIYDVIVFSHLRWDFVYQRPQHIISRIAKTQKVLFVEEPIPYAPTEENTANLIKVDQHLSVLQPRTSDIASISSILPQYIADSTIPVIWFYSAAFVPLLSSLKYKKIVYDCMDELTMFKGARPELRQQERYLLTEAEVVFTGGKSLYESKSKQHKNVFCFPSSVDRNHFAKALNGIPVASRLPSGKPIVGYYGVVDERIDLDLLQKTARLTPEVDFVMVGPLAKIDDKDLPRCENIHYTGMAPYADLPNYLKGFNVAMMPFALNDSTTFISPTKTLEYMAAYKPIVSTPIFDVVRDYAHCVEIIRTPEEFSAAIRTALAKDAKQCAASYEKILQETSWDNTVQKMMDLINVEAL